jgi:hypothetical protein
MLHQLALLVTAADALPLQEMWIRYCDFIHEKTSATPDDMRSLYERAVAACGTDPRTQNHIWDNYIKFETSQSDFSRVAAIYRRVLSIPMVSLDDIWSRWVQFSLQQPSSVLATPEELQVGPACTAAIALRESIWTIPVLQKFKTEAGEDEVRMLSP